MIYLESVFTRKSIDQVKRRSIGTSFMESKDFYLLSPPTLPIGIALTTPRMMIASNGDDLAGMSRQGHHGTSVARSRYLGSRTPSLQLSPRRPELESPLREGGLLEHLDSISIDLSGLPLLVEDSNHMLPLNNDLQYPFSWDEEEAALEREKVDDNKVRGSRIPGGSDGNSKHGVRKEWQSIFRQVNDLLSKSSNGNMTNGPSSVSRFQVFNGRQQISEEEAMRLLCAAAALPTYVNAPGECFAETVRSSLGELLLVS